LDRLIYSFKPHALISLPHTPLPAYLPDGLKTVYIEWKNSKKRPLIQINDRRVGQLAAEHFLNHSIHHTCFVGHLDRSYATERETGFRLTMKRGGYAPKRFHTQGTFLGLLNDNSNPTVAEAFRSFLHTLPRPLGIFAADDFVAFSIIELCQSTPGNNQIPDDIRVLGTNNEELVCLSCTPELSSIRLPYRPMGLQAGAWANSLLNGMPAPQTILKLDPIEVIERQSSAPALVTNLTVQKALKFIDAHLTESITTQDLLELTGLSRSTLERFFKEAVNRTPYHQILHQKIARAKHLLNHTNLPIHAIAPRCGFNSNTRFCQNFKIQTDLTPSEYRNLYR
jgi:LacI family transcriptional regulator